MVKKILLLLLVLFLFYGCGQKESKPMFVDVEKSLKIDSEINNEKELKPFLKEGNKKFKIAVIESGNYYAYFNVAEALFKGLMTLGWIKELEIRDGESQNMRTGEYIKKLRLQNCSDYIEIGPELYFDLNWDEKRADSAEFKKIISKENGVDLVICLGTYAAKAVLKQPGYNTPTLIDAVADSVGSGLSKTTEDSGVDFVTNRCDPEQYKRQIELFYNVVKFKKLGIIYEESENGRIYGAVKDIERAAKEKGFEIVRKTNVLAEPTDEELGKAAKLYNQALEELCPEVDALFLGICGGLEDENMPNVIEILNKQQKPSFSMEGSTVVKKGALLGVSGYLVKSTGIYNAEKVIEILKGKKPRELSQTFENVPKIAVNVKTAQIIGFDIPIDVISSSDEIYREFEGADKNEK